MTNLDFADIADPFKVANFLRQCAQSSYEGAAECEGAWQDRGAGAPWVKIARELERAAARIEKAIS